LKLRPFGGQQGLAVEGCGESLVFGGHASVSNKRSRMSPAYGRSAWVSRREKQASRRNTGMGGRQAVVPRRSGMVSRPGWWRTPWRWPSEARYLAD
jgi:hypothetical protein